MDKKQCSEDCMNVLQRTYNFLSVSVNTLGPALDLKDKRSKELTEIYKDLKDILATREQN